MMAYNKFIFTLTFLLIFTINSFSQQFFNSVYANGLLTKEKTDFISRVTGAQTLGQTLISMESLQNAVNDRGQLDFVNPLTGESLQASPFRVSYQDENNYSWTGKLDEKGSLLTIIRNQAGSIGMLKHAQKHYFIHPITPEVSLFVETNKEDYQNIQCATENLELNENFNASNNDECELDYDCNEVIDVLVIFTPDALDFLQGLPNPFFATLYVAFGVETMNVALDNSGVDSEMRYAWTSYNFPHHDLHNIKLDRDILSEDPIVEQIRNTYGADLVVLMTDRGYGASHGIAETTVPHIDSVTAIVEIRSIFGPRWTFAHELSHLFGALHNRTSNLDPEIILGDDTDICSHGWRFIDDDNAIRRSLMARYITGLENGRELLLSNPDIEFNGAATGTSENNNAGRIRNTACEIADYRDSPYFSAAIVGNSRLCMCTQAPEESIYAEHRLFTAEVNEPSSPFPGGPPYSYDWYWNQSGIFTPNNPGELIGSEESISVNITPCDHFFLRLVVTAEDGTIYESVRRIATDQCHDCAHYPCFVNGNGQNKLINKNVNLRNTNVFSNNIEINPNPAKDEINISYNIDKDIKVTTFITDVNGRIVFWENEVALEKGLYNRRLSIQGFVPGVYVFVQKRGEQYFTQKIIKQ